MSGSSAAQIPKPSPPPWRQRPEPSLQRLIPSKGFLSGCLPYWAGAGDHPCSEIGREVPPPGRVKWRGDEGGRHRRPGDPLEDSGRLGIGEADGGGPGRDVVVEAHHVSVKSS